MHERKIAELRAVRVGRPNLGTRQVMYVEDRLLAPATPLTEAVTRLVELGEPEAAEFLADALRDLHDVCRAVRLAMFYPTRATTDPR